MIILFKIIYNFYVMNRKILEKTFTTKKIDAIISFSAFTRQWYAKVKTTEGILVMEPKTTVLFVDSRYIEYCQAQAQNVTTQLLTAPTWKKYLAKNKLKYQRVGIEAEYITVAQLSGLKKLLPKTKFVEISGAKLRMIKSEDEIKDLKMAARINLQALEQVKSLIKKGTSEKTIDHQLNLAMKQLGADKESFDSIVVSGPRGSLPHGNPSDRKLNKGELVTIDSGVIYRGYVSDITRTFFVGKVKDKQLLTILATVKEAQRLGIAAIKPGITTSAIDKICRDYITKQGYGKYFSHSTGHGVGVEVHELPNVTSTKGYDVKLEPGMVITVEPGIYIPNVGGARIEDDILVTPTGHEVISQLN